MNKEFKVIDLTHTLTPSIPTFDDGTGFEFSIASDYKDYTTTDVFRTQKIKCGAGIGTHMDAPAHCVPGGKTIEDLDAENLVTDCVVVDVSDEAGENYVIMPEAIEKFEKEYGEIKPNTFVIFYTGWDKYWDDPKKYRNDYKFPSVHEQTAQMLLKRDIAGLGIDTLSPDTGVSGFPVHRAILGAGKYLVENITNLKEMPPIGAKSLVLPMKMIGATEAPVRLIALVS